MSVNGEIVTTMGVKVDDSDEVVVDGNPIRPQPMAYVLLNKPTGVVTTLYDPQRRPTIVRYLPDLGIAIKPVGRLDQDTEGLLICTNDGELAARLAHPRYNVDKVYQVTVLGLLEDEDIHKLETGIFIEGKRTAPAKVSLSHRSPEATSFRMTIHEGRNRQIRRMCEAVGHPVKVLRRIKIGPVTGRGMRTGEARMLTQEEISKLKQLVGLVDSVPAPRPKPGRRRG